MDEGSGRSGPGAGQRGRGSRPPRLSTVAGGGLEFAVAILLGVFAGQWLDRRWGTSPWLVVLGLYGLVGVRVFAVPPEPALVSLAVFFFLSTLIEPWFLRS